MHQDREESLPERAAGPPGERVADLVQRLGTLITPEEGAVETARGELRALAHEPDGPRILSRVADRLQADGGFDLEPVALQEILRPDPVFQSETSAGGLARTVTTVRIKAEPRAVRRAVLERPWTWWRHSKIRDWQRTEEGGSRFVIEPVSPASRARLRLPAVLGIELSPPTVAAERWAGNSRRKIVLPARFFHDFDGPGRYEILDLDGGSVLRSVWDGVERKTLTIKLMPMWLFLRIHLAGEKGTLRWPFPTGTGYLGLIDELEGTDRAMLTG